METLAKMSALCRDNLLINSDYKSGIINQIGYEGYRANGGYTIDMWQVLGSGAITIKDRAKNDSGKIVVFWKDNNVDGEAKYRQILTEERRGTFTFTTYLVACTKGVKMYIVDTDNNVYDKQVDVGINSMTYTGKIKEVGLLTSELSGSCYIDFLKLEYGKIFTGMPEWNPVLEELKCNKSLYVVDLQNSKVVSNMNATLLSAEIPIPSSMRKIPSIAGITFPLTFNLRKDGNDYSGLQATGINSVILKKNKVLITFSLKTNTLITRSIYVFVDDIKFYLDSYDY